MAQRVQELVNVEQKVRNLAAHSIVSATPEWVKERTGKSVDEIMWLIKYICEKVGIADGQESWRSYDWMNKKSSKDWTKRSCKQHAKAPVE